MVGCATKHTPGTADYRPLDPAHILAPLPEPASTNVSTIIVKRDNGLSGMALSALFTINGIDTAKFPAGTFLKFPIESGEHIFGVKSLKKGFPFGTTVFREIPVDCKPDKTYYLRLYVDFEEGIQIQRSSY